MIDDPRVAEIRRLLDRADALDQAAGRTPPARDEAFIRRNVAIANRWGHLTADQRPSFADALAIVTAEEGIPVDGETQHG